MQVLPLSQCKYRAFDLLFAFYEREALERRRHQQAIEEA
jgi:hypothetical protein